MATRFRGTAAQTRALDAFITLMRGSAAIARQVEKPLAAAGVAPAQLGVLEALLHLGPLYQRELASKLLCSPANITAVIDQLEARGDVRRERGLDRRQFTIHLTPAGRQAIQALFPSHVGTIVAAFSALTATEQKELTRLCRKLGTAAQSAKGSRR